MPKTLGWNLASLFLKSFLALVVTRAALDFITMDIMISERKPDQKGQKMISIFIFRTLEKGTDKATFE
jgi:hypothetical protein